MSRVRATVLLFCVACFYPSVLLAVPPEDIASGTLPSDFGQAGDAVPSGDPLEDSQRFENLFDEAGVLELSQRHEVSQSLHRIELEKGIRIVVVTLESLGPVSIEEFSSSKLKQISLPDRQVKAMIVLSMNDRRAHIQVVGELRQRFSRGALVDIVESEMIPLLRKEKYQQSFELAVTRLLEGSALPGNDLGQARSPDSAEREGIKQGAPIISVETPRPWAFYLLVLVPLVLLPAVLILTRLKKQ